MDVREKLSSEKETEKMAEYIKKKDNSRCG